MRKLCVCVCVDSEDITNNNTINIREPANTLLFVYFGLLPLFLCLNNNNNNNNIQKKGTHSRNEEKQINEQSKSRRLQFRSTATACLVFD